MQDFKKDYNSIIRRRIKKYRKLRGYSQEFLAEKANISREHMNKIENGKGTLGLNNFIQIAIALEVSLNDLVGL